MTEEVLIPAGEHRTMVLLNAPGCDLHIVQEADSSLLLHVVSLRQLLGEPQAAVPVRYGITVEQRGCHCHTELYGLAHLTGSEQVLLETHVQHVVGGGTSKQLVKFVLDDESKGRFEGQLYIAPDAQQTEAHQTNRNLLLSERADMRTQPQLEIYANDVQATHGASTGRLDESAVFYMQQRGIGLKQARRLLVGAFMKEVLSSLEDEALRDRLADAIDGIVE